GKGYANDLAVAAMREAGAIGGMVDLGGQGRGFGRAGPDPGRGVPGIRHPRDPRNLMGTIELTSGSLSTGGDYEQMFVEGGVRYSHIMDPRTGMPARGVIAVTVAAPDGMTLRALDT